MSNGFGNDPIPGIGKTEDRLGKNLQTFGPDTVCLRIMNGPAKGRTFRLDKPCMLVGRNDPPVIKVDMDLADCELGAVPMISRRHAEFVWNDGRLEIVDLGSTNGTWVNGEKLTPTSPGTPSAGVMLLAGSEVRLANIEFGIAVIDD